MHMFNDKGFQYSLSNFVQILYFVYCRLTIDKKFIKKSVYFDISIFHSL